MREISISEKKIRVRATPLALLFYKQEFKTDLIGDLMKMRDMENDPTKYDSVFFMQMIWAMAKADVGLGQFPSFLEWVVELPSFDMSDAELLGSVLEEAADGFFRGGSRPE